MLLRMFDGKFVKVDQVFPADIDHAIHPAQRPAEILFVQFRIRLMRGLHELLMMRVVQTNENFTSKDLPAIRKVFFKINRQNSAPGSRVQDAGGRWQTL